MTYAEAIEYLYKLRWFGAKLGLANTLRLAEMVGNPQERLRFIHVAGTNGKGSTCAMLESIYGTAGLRVGLFTSPHLVAFGERIQVNRQIISEQEIVRQVGELKPLLAQFPTEHHPTFFEVVTVMALRHFAQKKCDLVIWETGLGGRLDATNIVTPVATVITNVQYDHQQWLGSTLASIAAEKAGIIKPGIPGDLQRPPLDSIELPLLGRHQRINAAVAVATVRAVQPILPISEDAVRRGLLQVQWPGRMQLLSKPSGQRILLDGAHNAAGAQALATSLREYFPDERFTLILGILGDKDWQQIAEVLAPLGDHIRIVPVDSDRTASTKELARACQAANPKALVSEDSNIAQALEACLSDPFTVVTGSLYLVGEALEALRIGSFPGKKERALNEWQPSLNKRS